MDRGVILLTALHQYAACSGRFHRLRRGLMGLASPFNVMVCSRQPIRDGFLEYVGEPWMKEAKLLVRRLQASDAAQLQKEASDALVALGAGPSPNQDDFPLTPADQAAQFKKHVADLHRVLHPHVVIRSPLPSTMVSALGASHDRVVLSLRGSLDPAAELLNAGRTATADLCSLLARSWEDMDLPSPDGVARRGVVHLLWRAKMSAARQLVCGKRSAWCATPPPVLLIRQERVPGHLAALPEPTWSEWEHRLKLRYRARCEVEHDRLWELSAEATERWGEFHRQLLAQPQVFAPFPLTFFDWLPELMLRLAMLIMPECFKSREECRTLIISGEAAARACTVTWWLAHEHLTCLRALLEPPSPSEIDGMEGPLGAHPEDQLAIEAAILSKLQEKGPLRPRPLTPFLP
jgi:hypothetical protein